MYTVILTSGSNTNLIRCLSYLHEPRIIIVRENPENYSRSTNIAIRACDPDDVFLYCDDLILETPNGIKALEAVATAHPEIGVLASSLVGPICNPDQHPHPGPHLWQTTYHMLGFAGVYITRQNLNRIGLFDERFIGYGYQDNDYCRRARLLGLKLAVCGLCRVDHHTLPSVWRTPTLTPPNVYNAASELNRRLYLEKWTDTPPPPE